MPLMSALFTRTSRRPGLRRVATPHRRMGAGEPVVLVHPFMLSHHHWKPVMERLAATGHDVLAISMPGHLGGPELTWLSRMDEMIDHLEATMDEAGWDTAHVVGNSLGGWAALELGLRGRARSVTAIAPAGGYSAIGARDFAMIGAFIGTASLRRVLAPVNELPLPARRMFMKALSHTPGLVDPVLARRVARTALAAPQPLMVLTSCIRSLPISGLEAMAAPVHLVFAEKDLVIPPKHYAAYFTDRLPHAKVTHLPAVGHCPQVEAPALVVDTIRDTIAYAAGVATPAANG